MMDPDLNILVKPTEIVPGVRKIYLRSNRGETWWRLDEAVELLIQLTAAVERAVDPTPLPKPERIFAAPLPPVKASRPVPLDIGDLL